MDDRISFSNIMKGVGKEFRSLGIVLIIVFILTIVMGGLFYALNEGVYILIYAGVAFSFFLVIVVIAIGLFLNLYLFKKIQKKKGGFWRSFRTMEIPVKKYTRRYRSLYFVQKIAFIVIIVLTFFVMLVPTGIVTEIMVWIHNGYFILGPIALPMILITVTLPAMAWVVFTYTLDPYEPEPRALIIIGVLWGILSTFPSLFLNTFNGMWMDGIGLNSAVISAPIFEEFFKSIGFLLIFSYIKDETDGIIYGATFGAGFSLMENLIYGGNAIFEGGGLLFVILVGFRSFFNIVGHMIGPSIIGFLIGLNKRVVYPGLKKSRSFTPSSTRAIYLVILAISIYFGYLLSVLGHGIWNFLVGFGFSWLFIIALFFGLFQMTFFISLSLFGYYLATRRYNRKVKAEKKT